MGRCGDVLTGKKLLGETFSGILVSDRWRACAWVDVTRRQLCWAQGAEPTNNAG